MSKPASSPIANVICVSIGVPPPSPSVKRRSNGGNSADASKQAVIYLDDEDKAAAASSTAKAVRHGQIAKPSRRMRPYQKRRRRIRPEPTHEDDLVNGVTFNPVTKRYMQGTIRFRALLRQLQDHFYPAYQFERATVVSRPLRTPVTKPRRAPKLTLDEKRIRACTIGTNVDTFIGTIVQLIRRHGCLGVADFMRDEDAQYPALDDQHTLDQIRYIRKHMREGVRRILQYFVLRGWTPIHSQMVVSWPEARLATMADVVCRDQNGNHIVVEIKTGYKEAQLHSHTKFRMQPPFHLLDDSPYNQHLLQVAFTRHMYCRSIGVSADSPAVHARIIRSRPAGIETNELKSDISAAVAAALEVIAAS
jgi:hypothetical protein